MDAVKLTIEIVILSNRCAKFNKKKKSQNNALWAKTHLFNKPHTVAASCKTPTETITEQTFHFNWSQQVVFDNMQKQKQFYMLAQLPRQCATLFF